jgi:hypothetical protein
MAEKKPARAASKAHKKAAPKAADTEGHGKVKRPVARMAKKAAPAAADTAGHVNSHRKESHKR